MNQALPAAQAFAPLDIAPVESRAHCGLTSPDSTLVRLAAQSLFDRIQSPKSHYEQACKEDYLLRKATLLRSEEAPNAFSLLVLSEPLDKLTADTPVTRLIQRIAHVVQQHLVPRKLILVFNFGPQYGSITGNCWHRDSGKRLLVNFSSQAGCATRLLPSSASFQTDRHGTYLDKSEYQRAEQLAITARHGYLYSPSTNLHHNPPQGQLKPGQWRLMIHYADSQI